MSFTLWLSAEEERILAKIMRSEGTRTKEQAVIKAIRDKADSARRRPHRPGDPRGRRRDVRRLSHTSAARAGDHLAAPGRRCVRPLATR